MWLGRWGLRAAHEAADRSVGWPAHTHTWRYMHSTPLIIKMNNCSSALPAVVLPGITTDSTYTCMRHVRIAQKASHMTDHTYEREHPFFLPDCQGMPAAQICGSIHHLAPQHAINLQISGHHFNSVQAAAVAIDACKRMDYLQSRYQGIDRP